MKNYLNKTLQLAAGVLAFPPPLMAQDAKDNQKDKEKKSPKIVIIRKGDKRKGDGGSRRRQRLRSTAKPSMSIRAMM